MTGTAEAAVFPASAEGPSDAARMICSSETRHAVAITLALPASPVATPTWHDGLYTCTFALPAGQLILSVKELNDEQAAQQHLIALSEQIAPAEQIVGLPSLGLSGYQSEAGNVIFAKDAMTLQVDATTLPAELGSKLVSRDDFAYQIATVILACWTAHH